MKFLVALAVFGGANVYLFARGFQALPAGWLRRVYCLIFVCVFASFFIGMIFGDKLPMKLTSALQFTGTSWLFAMIYLTLAALFFDLLRVGNRIFDFFPSTLLAHYSSVKLSALCFSLIITCMIFVWGNYHFNRPSVQRPTMKSLKSFTAPPPRIVVASDIHLGYTIGKKTLEKYVRLINAQNPDAVLLCGDIFDRDLRPVKSADMAAELRAIKAPLGVFAVLGNHEYYGNSEKLCEYLRESGIIVLQDSVVNLNEDVVLVGRDDLSNRNRKDLSELMQNIDRNKFIVLLDHQPYNFDEAVEAGVDIQFSGHTHDGQAWPINLIARRIFEKSYGYLRKGASQFYVTSGLGLWGPHLRVGTVSEIVVPEF
ncbi:MAG: metallophosphoesterase [Prevotellaceae bacterium]|jgi:predicted MPP superfamily phosphohydrolase|nr:metallophosphoesterase [Prevotellaceae bacterium]